MSNSTQLTGLDCPVIDWPACENEPPCGWHWGAYVALGSKEPWAYYLVEDEGERVLIARQMPDVQDIPSDDDIEQAFREYNDSGRGEDK